ncbi:MAG: cell division topological specificity factor MinE [Betaproteobacteria bacterium]|nr:cell division topological specificity factor MinE [Betaproteobacteria bacterium]
MSVQSFLNRFFGGKSVHSAQTAKNRLAAVIAYERSAREEYDFMPALQRDLIEVLSRYFPVNPDDISINRESQGNSEVLEINIALPESVGSAT